MRDPFVDVISARNHLTPRQNPFQMNLFVQATVVERVRYLSRSVHTKHYVLRTGEPEQLEVFLSYPYHIFRCPFIKEAQKHRVIERMKFLDLKSR